MDPKLKLVFFLIALILFLVDALYHRSITGLTSGGLAAWVFIAVVDTWDSI